MALATTDYCPPHYFVAAWQTESQGVIYCRLCGEIRELAPQSVEAPVEEKVNARQQASDS